jgi:hypothetical protein
MPASRCPDRYIERGSLRGLDRLDAGHPEKHAFQAIKPGFRPSPIYLDSRMADPGTQQFRGKGGSRFDKMRHANAARQGEPQWPKPTGSSSRSKNTTA